MLNISTIEPSLGNSLVGIGRGSTQKENGEEKELKEASSHAS
jgi:hypothetical protein